MCDLRILRGLAACLAGACCLLAPMLATGVVPALAQDAHAARTTATATESGAHDHCWDAEVDAHQRHEDRRYESQRGLHHHLHAAVAWSGAAFVEPPARIADGELPRLDTASSDDDPSSRRKPSRSPRQSRAPPRA